MAMQKVKKQRSKKWLVNLILGIICFIWIIPTFGLLVSSFRSPDNINSSGWWTVFPHKDWVTSQTIQLPHTTDFHKPITVKGHTYTDKQLQEGIIAQNQKIMWENRLSKTIGIQEKKWVMGNHFTLSNYNNVLSAGQVSVTQGGVKQTVQGEGLGRSFLNTLAVSIPATIIPITISIFAAYALAWMKFPGRKIFLAVIVGLLVVPAQVALVPDLKSYMALGINGTYLAVWLTHTVFGLSLTTYFLHNYISDIPRSIFESAFIDGASHFNVFTRLIVPLSVPAIASIGIFQFLWVWNDYLISLIYLSGVPGHETLTMALANMVGSRGSDWQLLTSGAFVSMLLPLLVFFFMQRYFVRGMLGGAEKG
jgi:alpha-glucoside transport system permease protein